MAGNLTAMIAAAFSGGAAPPVTSDPYYEYTTLLLPGNGTNGAQNNTFLDGSTNNFTITRNGNTTQGTFSPFSQTGWGAYFDGASDYIQFTNSDFSVSTGDFTAEWWMFVTSDKSQVGVMTAASNANLTIGYGSGSANARQVYVEWGGSGAYIGSMSNYANSWVHICVMRSSGTVYTFQNGTLLSSASKSAALGSTANMVIGTNSGDIAAQSFPGYLSNVRFSKVAVYSTSGFTPSTSPLTRTSQGATDVQFLTLQSNRFLDSNGVNTPASSPLTITKNGDTSVVAFSPFNPSASWSAATYGGSGYFDGSGDYLTGTNNSAYDFGSGDFTIEAFAYPTTASQLAFCARGETTGFSGFILSTTNFLATTNGSSWDISISFTTSLTANAWNHVALVRNGNVYTAYLNGVANGTTTVSGTIVAGTAALTIGRRSGQTDYSGYLSSLRLVKGTAVYTAAFTPPTAPLTAITNTSLLLNFTNAGIYDATSKNDLETVADAKISTAQSKWGGSSMYFDGNDNLFVANNSILSFGSGDFTFECWVYLTTTSGNRCIYFQNYGNFEIGILVTSSSTLRAGSYTAGGSANFDFSSSATVAANQWNHVALVRSGSGSNNVVLYLNGVNVASATFTGNVTNGNTSGYVIGRDYGTTYMTGYIQDLRITKGYARYTANFTAPTAAFPTL